MHNILIIDDNEWVVADFKTIIDWEKYSIKLYSANNGENGLKIIEENTIDAVFTDIKMPGISGIEVLKSIKETHSHIPVIVISAYEEFSLAKDAIRHGALDYITKPVNRDEITNIVENFLGIVYSREKEASLQFQRVLAQHLLYIPDSFEAGSALDEYLNGSLCSVVKISLDTTHNTAPYIENAITEVRVSEKIYYYIFTSEKDPDSFIESVKKSLEGKCINAGISECYSSMTNLSDMISQADEAYNTAIFHGIQLCKYEEFCGNYELFLNTLKSTRDIDVLWNTFFSIGVPKWELKHIAESLNIIFSSNIDEKSLEAFNASNIFEHETADALWGFLNGFRQNVPDIPPESFDVMKEVVADIKRDFSRKITLKEYAQKHFMSTPNFSKLFKLYTGMTYTEYVRKLRFEKACLLLTTTKMSILDIALELGYDDYYHFSKQFKRTYSISPTNYRKLYFLCN